MSSAAINDEHSKPTLDLNYPVWKFFEVSLNHNHSVFCKICKWHTTNTSNINKLVTHLRSAHGIDPITADEMEMNSPVVIKDMLTIPVALTNCAPSSTPTPMLLVPNMGNIGRTMYKNSCKAVKDSQTISTAPGVLSFLQKSSQHVVSNTRSVPGATSLPTPKYCTSSLNAEYNTVVESSSSEVNSATNLKQTVYSSAPMTPFLDKVPSLENNGPPDNVVTKLSSGSINSSGPSLSALTSQPMPAVIPSFNQSPFTKNTVSPSSQCESVAQPGIKQPTKTHLCKMVTLVKCPNQGIPTSRQTTAGPGIMQQNLIVSSASLQTSNSKNLPQSSSQNTVPAATVKTDVLTKYLLIPGTNKIYALPSTSTVWQPKSTSKGKQHVKQTQATNSSFKRQTFSAAVQQGSDQKIVHSSVSPTFQSITPSVISNVFSKSSDLKSVVHSAAEVGGLLDAAFTNKQSQNLEHLAYNVKLSGLPSHRSASSVPLKSLPKARNKNVQGLCIEFSPVTKNPTVTSGKGQEPVVLKSIVPPSAENMEVTLKTLPKTDNKNVQQACATPTIIKVKTEASEKDKEQIAINTFEHPSTEVLTALPKTDNKDARKQLIRKKVKRTMKCLSRKMRECKCCYVVVGKCYPRSNTRQVKSRKAKFSPCPTNCRVAFLDQHLEKHGDHMAPNNLYVKLYRSMLRTEMKKIKVNLVTSNQNENSQETVSSNAKSVLTSANSGCSNSRQNITQLPVSISTVRKLNHMTPGVSVNSAKFMKKPPSNKISSLASGCVGNSSCVSPVKVAPVTMLLSPNTDSAKSNGNVTQIGTDASAVQAERGVSVELRPVMQSAEDILKTGTIILQAVTKGNQLISGAVPSMAVSGAVPSITVPGVAPSVTLSRVVSNVAVTGVVPRMGISGVVPSVAVSGAVSGVAVSGAVPSMATSGVPPSMAISGAIPSMAVSGAVPNMALLRVVPSMTVSRGVPNMAISGAVPSMAVQSKPNVRLPNSTILTSYAGQGLTSGPTAVNTNLTGNNASNIRMLLKTRLVSNTGLTTGTWPTIQLLPAGASQKQTSQPLKMTDTKIQDDICLTTNSSDVSKCSVKADVGLITIEGESKKLQANTAVATSMSNQIMVPVSLPPPVSIATTSSISSATGLFTSTLTGKTAPSSSKQKKNVPSFSLIKSPYGKCITQTNTSTSYVGKTSSLNQSLPQQPPKSTGSSGMAWTVNAPSSTAVITGYRSNGMASTSFFHSYSKPTPKRHAVSCIAAASCVTTLTTSGINSIVTVNSQASRQGQNMPVLETILNSPSLSQTSHAMQGRITSLSNSNVISGTGAKKPTALITFIPVGMFSSQDKPDAKISGKVIKCMPLKRGQTNVNCMSDSPCNSGQVVYTTTSSGNLVAAPVSKSTTVPTSVFDRSSAKSDPITEKCKAGENIDYSPITVKSEPISTGYPDDHNEITGLCEKRKADERLKSVYDSNKQNKYKDKLNVRDIHDRINFEPVAIKQEPEDWSATELVQNSNSGLTEQARMLKSVEDKYSSLDFNRITNSTEGLTSSEVLETITIKKEPNNWQTEDVQTSCTEMCTKKRKTTESDNCYLSKQRKYCDMSDSSETHGYNTGCESVSVKQEPGDLPASEMFDVVRDKVKNLKEKFLKQLADLERLKMKT